MAVDFGYWSSWHFVSMINPNSEPESRFVLRAISQPYNVLNYDDDIALLRLNDRVPINHIIRPICLPNQRGKCSYQIEFSCFSTLKFKYTTLDNNWFQKSTSASHYAHTLGIVAGWGSMTEEGKRSCVVQDVKVPILTNLDRIQSTSYKSGMVTENMMCAGQPDGEIDSCQVIYWHFQIKLCLHFENLIWIKIVFQWV